MPETRGGQLALRFDRIAALCFGLMMSMGLAPVSLGPVAFVGLTAALWLASKARNPRRAALLGWLLGVGYFGAGLHWIVEPFLVDATVTGWMAPFALIGLSGGLALFWALAFWGGARLGGSVWAVALVWALAEAARGLVLTGFPWALISHIWSGSVVLHWGAFLGPYGVTLLTLLAAALPLWAWSRLRQPVPSLALALGAITTLYGVGLWQAERGDAKTMAAAPVLRLVQPNARQDQKWDPQMMPVFFNRMTQFSSASPAPALVIWPESALPMLLEDAGEALSYIAEQARVPAAIGVQRRGDHPTLFYNSLVVTDATGAVQEIYDKHHLVPFGEYMPVPAFWRALGIETLAARTEFGYAPGPGKETVDIPGIGRALPLICYEAVFARHARLPGTERPDLLLQVTNDAWFGAAVGPWQHLEQARMRAIEQGLPLVRVANTGVSAMIDGKGRVTGRIDLGVAAYLDRPLPPPLAPTLYARWGDGPVWAVMLLGCALIIALRVGRSH